MRLSARGDVVFSSPLVRAFRRTYPEARLSWIAESHTKDLIEHHPELDEVIVWDREGWKRLWRERRYLTLLREARELVRGLRSRRFDVAIDLQGLLRSGIITLLSGASVRVGLGSKEGTGLLMSRVLDRTKGDHSTVSSEYRLLAEELGLDVGDFRMEVPLPEEDRRWGVDKIRQLGLEGGYLVAIPFTTRPQKHWFEDRWARLMDQVREELGLPTVVLGGPGDRPAVGRILEMTRTPPISLVGETTLTQATAMVEGASLVIGVDTGLTHIAVAFDRPTVAIFGSTIPYTAPPTDRGKVLVHRLECSPCRGNPTCDGEYTCLRRVTVEEVLGAARLVMANGERDRARRQGRALPLTQVEEPGAGAGPVRAELENGTGSTGGRPEPSGRSR